MPDEVVSNHSLLLGITKARVAWLDLIDICWRPIKKHSSTELYYSPYPNQLWGSGLTVAQTQNSPFPLNSLLVLIEDRKSIKNNNYSIIQNSNCQSIFLFFSLLGVLHFFMLWLGIISSRTSLWSHINSVAFIGRGELQSRASLGGGTAQCKAAVAHSSRGFRIPPDSFYGSPWNTQSFPILSCLLSWMWSFP